MRKLLTRSLLLIPVSVVVLYILQLDRKKTQNDSTCQISNELLLVEKALGCYVDRQHHIQLLVHINPQCNLCHLLLEELSQWDQTFDLIILSFHHREQTQLLLQQWSWCITPQLVFSDEASISRIFCKSQTPAFLIFKTGRLLHHQFGINQLARVKKILHTF